MHVSVSTVRRLARAGLITEIQVSAGAVRVEPGSVREYLASRRRTGESQ
jgi:predicted site-specific integrase-resolvase